MTGNQTVISLAISQTAAFDKAGAAGRQSQEPVVHRSSAFPVLLVAAWCGLVSGLLEVGTIIVRKLTIDPNHFYNMTRHFVWLIPLTNLFIFTVFGVVFWLVIRGGYRRGYWLTARLLAAMTLLPAFWVAFPRIFGPAGVLLVLGAAVHLVPALEAHANGFRRLVRISFPVVAVTLPLLATTLWGLDRIKEWREETRPLPPPGSANMLLIVLDTVGAEHLSAYGYNRQTSPTIDEWASRGIRFDRVQATSSWTLPSHASMITGRWPHELSAGWLTPLDRTYPTLAEFLGSRGYATAAFVANYWYCATDSGLSRGFTAYRDYSPPRLTALKTAILIDRPVNGLRAVNDFLKDWLDAEFLKPAVGVARWLFQADQKEATEVNREFLDWMSRRQHNPRPFFAFLNFFDAHHPYKLPLTCFRRFRREPDDDSETDPIEDELLLGRGGPTEKQIAPVRDSYDDCVANLDEQLGRLLDELARRSVLDRTWVIITADHGESFGEHPGVFRHGMSLYQTELHVPLVIIPPPGNRSQRVVTDTVSLRDLAATIVDVLGFTAGSPFPGDSLARFWTGSIPTARAERVASDEALSEVVPADPFNPDSSQLVNRRWPLASLTKGDWTYIRREGDVREKLFRWRDDAKESRNLADNPSVHPTLEFMRGALRQLTEGPLTPERFNP